MKLSLLDLIPVNEGQTIKNAYDNSLIAAQKAEELNYNRIWIAEHHNTTAIASAATSVCISHIAHGTKNIRVGAGGIMLPNHSPLVIAEQFGTLETLFPGRIDLGLGRAPGTDQQTAQALRTDFTSANRFPDDVLELQRYFSKNASQHAIQASPGAGLEVPLWILGSSTFGAQLAASYGLPYAFASHFAPDSLFDALNIYRRTFKPSQQQSSPCTMAGINVVLADTDEEAQYLATSQQQAFVQLRRGVKNARYPKPINDMKSFLSDDEAFMLQHILKYSFVGTPETVKPKLETFIERTKVDELMVSMAMYDLNKKLYSLELLSKLL